jgi:hypothetical protein
MLLHCRSSRVLPALCWLLDVMFAPLCLQLYRLLLFIVNHPAKGSGLDHQSHNLVQNILILLMFDW